MTEAVAIDKVRAARARDAAARFRAMKHVTKKTSAEIIRECREKRK